MLSDLNYQNALPGCQNARSKIFESKNPSVLIADSDGERRDDLKNLCGLYDVAVWEAETGEEAFDLTVRARPDLILMNIKLPCLDGFEAARLIKKIQSLSRIPIIFLSSRTERVFRKRAFAATAFISNR